MSTKPATAQQSDIFDMPKGSIFKKLAYVLAFVGPASMICSTSMGPGTATSCIQAGASFGFDMLWAVILSGLMCGGVAYLGAKVTAISGKPAYEFIEEKIGRVPSVILFLVVLCTWYMVVYSQGATMMHLNNIIFGERFGTIAFIITIAIIAYLYVVSSNTSVVKIASIMCTLMAAIFFINIFVCQPSLSDMAKGLIPRIPGGVQGAIIMAGIVGGSAPGTSALWYSYSVKNQKWDTPKALGFIKYDQIIFAGMFTIFSLGIFISGAAVLNPAGIQVSSALDAAVALKPIAGNFATYIFIAGFWGAVFTTIGGMSTLATYCLNSMVRIHEDRTNIKVRKFVLIGIVVSLLGGLSGGNALSLLVNFMGALNIGGLVIIAILLFYCCNKKFTGPEYATKWYTIVLGLVILGFNVYSAWTYVARFL
ncbi:divalent metal cation transporter [Flavonifractor sp. AGMB03687]|uniref:NRAMP family divalent metal transporter n=1 Tax=Flavonifractor sp. AGMB03687 TaxID=2785133 RepID=UPI001AE0391F|nr:divalent metal cation transporter [Flavonifractor sp. AGMB03687]